jgi:hypothetical protein
MKVQAYQYPTRAGRRRILPESATTDTARWFEGRANDVRTSTDPKDSPGAGAVRERPPGSAELQGTPASPCMTP